MKIKRALISVSDKTGLEKIAKHLADNNVEIISTGGTGKYLTEHNIAFTPIEKITNKPEAFQGRMKTISFEIASSLLFKRKSASDVKEAKELNIEPIDLVICNLYPFEEVLKKGGSEEELIENVDIGGPTMIRAAAKNFNDVCILTSPNQYDDLIKYFTEPNLEMRKKWAMSAFEMTSHYDSLIFESLTTEIIPLRYGENPHQKAEFIPHKSSVINWQPIQGKALSYNNLLDADSAYRSCMDLHFYLKDQYAVSIIKHSNPCGYASGIDPLQTLKEAWEGDPVSAFGSIVCLSYPVEKEQAIFLTERFVEVILAPEFSSEALEIFKQKKNCRIVQIELNDYYQKQVMSRSIVGGKLKQDEDNVPLYEFQKVTKQKIQTDSSLKLFGVLSAKHLRSNAISLTRKTRNGCQLIGAGMGNPNRLVSTQQAIDKAIENKVENFKDILMTSDAFFPFPDNVELAASYGILSIIQPGGSIKDPAVFEIADELNIAMEITNMRNFRH